MGLSNSQGKKLYKYVSDYCIFDLETTGISCMSDEVIEISAIKVENGNIVGEYSTLVNPGRPIPYQASMVNGIYDDMVYDAPSFETALGEFLEFAADLPLVGHNISSFDMRFIYRDVEKYWEKTIDNDYIDTLQLARKCLPKLNSYKLTELANYYEINTEGAHRALNDCRMNQQVFEKLAEEMANSSVDVTPSKVCPKCGSEMVKRNGRFGAFFGCTGYPGCRYTENG